MVNTLDKKTSDFLNIVKDIAEKNNIKISLSEEENIQYPNSQMLCSGYFVDNNSPELGIAIGGDIKNWLLILVHEFSHMQQYLENSQHWRNNFVNNEESIEIIDRWINGDDTIQNVEKLISLSYAVEADCEIRSIANIKKYGLDIDIATYYQKANSYILFYAFMLEFRKWYSADKKPYRIKEVWEKMPNDKIIIDWETEYPSYKNLYTKHCF